MRGFLSYIMRGRVEAVMAATAFAVLTLIVPPLSYASGSTVGLATLRNGLAEGALVLAGPAAVAATLAAQSPEGVSAVLVFSLICGTWIGVWVLAGVLRRTASQAVTLAMAGLAGALVVAGVHLAMGDPVVHWRDVLERVFRQILTDEMLADPRAMQRLGVVIGSWAPMMTAYLGAVVVVNLMLTVCLARWLHAVLDNPGGFGREFRSLRVDRRLGWLAVTTVVVASLPAAGLGEFARGVLGPLVALYLIQALAVAHAVVTRRSASGWWLVLVYGALLLLPLQATLLFALLGLADGWVDFRERMS